MNPILDQLLVAACIGGALGFFALRAWRQRKGGCSSGCGCTVRPPVVPGGKSTTPPAKR